MDEPLDELYLRWLYSQVGRIRSKPKSKTYWGFLRQLYTMEFVWIVPNDDNRVADGVYLRNEFLDESGISLPDESWMVLGCSFLEMLIALSRRLSFEAEGEPLDWFWHLITNLQLTEWNDTRKFPAEEITEKLNAVIWRTYDPDGSGGLFPLKNPTEDQRCVEIWYQLNAYLLQDN